MWHINQFIHVASQELSFTWKKEVIKDIDLAFLLIFSELGQNLYNKCTIFLST